MLLLIVINNFKKICFSISIIVNLLFLILLHPIDTNAKDISYDAYLETIKQSQENLNEKELNYINLEGHYSFKLSNKWAEIPSSKIDEITKKVREVSGMESITYKTGFSLKESSAINYPYILVQEHNRDGATYTQFIKMYEDEDIITEIKEKADKITAIKGIEYNKPYVDKENKIFYMVFEMNVENVGKVKGLQAKFLGNEKYIDLNFYSLESEYENNLIEFNEIINSFKFDDYYKYIISTNEIKNAKSPSERVLISGIGGLIGGGIWGLVSLFGVFSGKNKKKNDSLDKEINEDNDIKTEAKNIEEEKKFIPEPIKIKRKMTFKLLRNKTFVFVLLGLLVISFIFYWTQIRVTNIRKNCYAEAFRKNEENFEWAEGKKWRYVQYAVEGGWGWAYPEYPLARYGKKEETAQKYKESREKIYKQCIVREGISNSF